jgi:excisionase family DNA binding protein
MANETIALSTIEAARELRCHPNTLLRWAAQGKVPYVRLGGRKLLFSRSEISKLVAGQSNQPPDNGNPKS